MDTENGRSDDYWMGVRDALRMVDSFLKWSRRNQEKAKTIDDFIHDGLIAAAKRCEQCLSHKLGVTFTDDDDVHDDAFQDDVRDDFHEPASTPTPPVGEVYRDEPPEEIELKPSGMDEIEEVPIVHDSEPEESPTDEDGIEPVSLDFMTPKEPTEDDDEYSLGKTRDFGSDFELDEPEPLVVEPMREERELPPIPSVEIRGKVETEDTSAETTKEPPKPELEEAPKGPSFTWTDYEEKMEPEDESKDTESSEEPTTSSAPESPKSWSPMDEPPDIPDEIHDDDDGVDDSEDSEEDDLESPPPPPPPEPDESEEERRRRARRLFFGA